MPVRTGTDGLCRSKVVCNEYGANPFVQNMEPLPDCTRREGARDLVLPYYERNCTYPKQLNESLWTSELQQQCCSEDAEPGQVLQAGLISLLGVLMTIYVIAAKPLIGSFVNR